MLSTSPKVFGDGGDVAKLRQLLVLLSGARWLQTTASISPLYLICPRPHLSGQAGQYGEEEEPGLCDLGQFI